jgi:hypothetical protein
MSSGVHGTQLEQDSNAFHALLEEGNITLHAWRGALNPPQRPQPRVHGDSAPWPRATHTNRRIC